MEIERKYLVTSDCYKALAIARYRIRQGYISREKTGTVRVRITDNQAFLTIKGKPAAGHFARYEWEKEIDVKEAEELMKLCQGTIIDKTRWIVPATEPQLKVSEFQGIKVSEGHCLKWEVDEFHGKHEGLVVAEIELEYEDQAFEKPNFIGEEVTSDPRYYNSRL